MSADYLDLSSAARRLGVHRRTLVRRINEYGIPLYADPSNRKRRLIRLDDVKSIETPRPLPRKTQVQEPQGAA